MTTRTEQRTVAGCLTRTQRHADDGVKPLPSHTPVVDPLRPLARLAQNEEPGGAGGEAEEDWGK